MSSGASLRIYSPGVEQLVECIEAEDSGAGGHHNALFECTSVRGDGVGLRAAELIGSCLRGGVRGLLGRSAASLSVASSALLMAEVRSEKKNAGYNNSLIHV